MRPLPAGSRVPSQRPAVLPGKERREQPTGQNSRLRLALTPGAPGHARPTSPGPRRRGAGDVPHAGAPLLQTWSLVVWSKHLALRQALVQAGCRFEGEMSPLLSLATRVLGQRTEVDFPGSRAFAVSTRRHGERYNRLLQQSAHRDRVCFRSLTVCTLRAGEGHSPRSHGHMVTTQ